MRNRHLKHIKVKSLSFQRLREIREWRRGITQMKSITRASRNWNFSFDFNMAMAREYRLEGKYDIAKVLIDCARQALQHPNFKRIPS